MRLKHRPWGDEFLLAHQDLIKNRDNISPNFFEELKSHEKLCLEIGVGRGDFIVGMAKKNPDKFYVGVELSGMALAIAGKKIITEELSNILLVNMDVHYLFEKMNEESFDCIYLNFSDPWPKKRQNKRRLTYPTCLVEYQRVLKKEGLLYFKTDNDVLFEDSITYFEESPLKVLSVTRDYELEDGDVVTEYEAKFRALGTKIKRIVAQKGEL